MQTVTNDFLTAIKATTRNIFGRIIIDYTSSEVDGSIEVTANETANVSHESQVANGVLSPTQKWLSLDGSWVLDGTYHLAPSVPSEGEMGWWGSSLATAGGTFTGTDPLLTVTFLPRPIRVIRVVGDDKRSEFPVDFEVKLFDGDDILLHTETVSANATINFSTTITQVNSVEKTTLEISKWSEAERQVKILEFYDSIIETYEGDDIIEFSTVEERDISNGSLPIGNISSNEISIKINNIDNRFDAGNTASDTFELLKPNRIITAFLGVELPDTSIEFVPMGKYFSEDWETPENEIWASTTGRDLMERMRKTTFSTSVVVFDSTLFALAETVLVNAGFTSANYTIDTELQDFTVPFSWFDPISHREALRQIVEASGGQAYVDRTGIIQVQGPTFFDSILSASLTLGLDDIWDKSNPVVWSEVSNFIQVSVKPLTLADSLSEVYRSTEPVEISAGQTLSLTVFYNTIPSISAVATISATTTAITDETFFAWGANIDVTNSGTASDTFTLIINALTLTEENKGTVVSQDANSILDNGKLVYEIPDNNLIQTTAFAQTLTDNILSAFKDPRRDITINWRGNPATELADRINAPDFKEISNQDYFVVKETFEFDGGLTSTINGRRP